ncbi:hypothetical protein HY009_07765 [Candidatus Acetothermia bacterium]|nr:hypothetical protein [Candidatus Acetothermia bacterium]
MTYRIRNFTPNDYEQVVQVYNAAKPDYPTTVEEMRCGTQWAHRGSRMV